MQKCHTVKHMGIEIVVVDLANSTPDQSIEIMANASTLISSKPEKSVRIFTDATNATYTTAVLSALKNFTTHNSRFVRASAVIGADGIRALAVATAAKVSGRKIKVFDNREQAFDWLITAN